MMNKENFKLAVLPSIAKLLHKIGVSWKTLGYSKINQYTVFAQSEVLHNDKWKSQIDQADKKMNIVFLTILGGHIYNMNIDLALANVLRARGHNVKFILDDSRFPISQLQNSKNEESWVKLNLKNYLWGKKFIDIWNFPVNWVSEYKKSYSGDLAFDEVLEASLLRHYKVGVLNDDLPRLEEVTNMTHESISISASLGQELSDLKPDAVIMSHGIYAMWGPAYQILRQNNIDVLTYGRGKKKGTSKFNWNCTADWWDVTEEWKSLSKRELTVSEESEIDSYLESRIEQKEDVFIYNFGDLESRQKTLKRFNLDENKTTYTLFTNVLWDAASAQREIVFTNPVEWVIDTIEWFRDNPDKQLLIKIHPAELVIGTNMKFVDIINNNIKDLPPNVILIDPSEKVNSWSIYSVTDLGIVHTTTVGMELPLRGIPCVVVSRTHYRGKGFTVDLDSKNEYFDYLQKFKKSMSLDQHIIKQAKKYAYLLFERYQMPLDLFDEKVSTDVRALKFNSIEELAQKPTISKVVKAIENKQISILN